MEIKYGFKNQLKGLRSFELNKIILGDNEENFLKKCLNDFNSISASLGLFYAKCLEIFNLSVFP